METVRQVLEKLEDLYYSFLDFLVEKGIPVDKIVGPLEERGIPTYPIFYAVLLLLVTGGAFLFVSTVAVPPKHVFYFTDADGNPLKGVKATFLVDGERVVFYSDEEGKIVVEGRSVEFLSAIYPGYMLRGSEEIDGTLTVILEPRVYTTRVKIRDSQGIPVKGVLKIYVDGAEVFSEEGSDFEVCFSEAEKKSCFLIGRDSEIEFVAAVEGLGEKRKTYSIDDLPRTIIFTLSREEVVKEEVVKNKTYAKVAFSARFVDDNTPVSGTLYVAPVDSPSTGTPVTIRSGVSAPINLSIGVYKIVSAQILYNGKYITVEVVDNTTFTVTEKTTLIEVLLKKPKQTFRIKVLVKDAESEAPIEGVSIVFSYEKGKIERTTDGSGAVVLEFSKEVCGTLSASKEGYESATTSACTGDEVILKLNKAIDTGIVKVIVYGPTGDPLPGAKVFLMTAEGTKTALESSTNQQGVALIENVPVGRYVTVAEFLSLSIISAEFEVEKDKVTEVPMYFTQNTVTLVVSVKKEGVPVLGAHVRVFDVRKHVLFEGITNIDGEVSGEVPPLLGIEVEVNYLGKVLRTGPYVIPGGISLYNVEVNIPAEEKPFIKLEGVYNEEGRKVSSIQKGRMYTMRFTVGFKGSGTFTLNIPEGVDVLSSSPAGTVEEGSLKIPLSAKDYTIMPVDVLLKVRYAYKDDLFVVEYTMNEISGEISLPVSKEYLCGEVVCYLATLKDENGRQIEPGENLEILKEYTLKVYVVSDADETLTIEVVKKAVSGDEEVLVSVDKNFGDPHPLLIQTTFQPLVEEGIIILLRVLADGHLIEEIQIGSWSVYIPDFGPLFSEYNVIDVETNAHLPGGWFLEGRTQKVIYRVFDANLQPPLTPADATVYCNDTPIATSHGYTGTITFTPTSCDSLHIGFSATGYEGSTVQLAKLDASKFVVSTKGSVLLSPEETVSAKLLVQGPVEVNLVGEGTLEECGLTYTIRNHRIQLFWTGSKCKGLSTVETFDANVLFYNIPLGSVEVPVIVQYGTLYSCIRVTDSRFYIDDTGFHIDARIKNGCDVPLIVDEASAELDILGLDRDFFYTDVDLDLVDVNIPPGSSFTARGTIYVDRYTPPVAGKTLNAFLYIVINDTPLLFNVLRDGADVSFESVCLNTNKNPLSTLAYSNEIYFYLDTNFRYDFCEWENPEELKAQIQIKDRGATHQLLGTLPLVFSNALRVYQPYVYVIAIEDGDTEVIIDREYPDGILFSPNSVEYKYSCRTRVLDTSMDINYHNIMAVFEVLENGEVLIRRNILLGELLSGKRYYLPDGVYTLRIKVYANHSVSVPTLIDREVKISCGGRSADEDTYLKDMIFLDAYEYDMGQIYPRHPSEYFSIIDSLALFGAFGCNGSPNYGDLYHLAMLVYEAVIEKACEGGICNFHNLDKDTVFEGLYCSSDMNEEYVLNLPRLIAFDLNELNESAGIIFEDNRTVSFSTLEAGGYNVTVEFNVPANGLLLDANARIEEINVSENNVTIRLTLEGNVPDECEGLETLYDELVCLAAARGLYDNLLIAMLRPLEETNKLFTYDDNQYSFKLMELLEYQKDSASYYVEGYCLEELDDRCGVRLCGEGERPVKIRDIVFWGTEDQFLHGQSVCK